MTDKDLFRIWNLTKGDNVSKKEIETAYSNVRKMTDSLEGRSNGHRVLKIFASAVAAAAVLLLVSVLSVSTYKHIHKSDALAVEESVKFIECVTGNGETKSVTLPDSTKIVLNSSSVVIYPSSFQTSERSVYLSGEAVFDVTKDEEKPFVVETSDFSVRVHGTKFDISAYSDADEISTTLCRGSVSVVSHIDRKEYLLVPDERFQMDRNTGASEILKIDSEEAVSWLNRSLCFRSASIHDIVKTIERQYDVHIYLTTSKYEDNIITAKFIHGETLDELMKALCLLTPGMSYSMTSDSEIYIK